MVRIDVESTCEMRDDGVGRHWCLQALRVEV